MEQMKTLNTDTEMSLIVDEIMGTGDKVNVDIISNVTKFKPKVLKVSSGSVEDVEEIVFIDSPFM